MRDLSAQEVGMVTGGENATYTFRNDTQVTLNVGYGMFSGPANAAGAPPAGTYTIRFEAGSSISGPDNDRNGVPDVLDDLRAKGRVREVSEQTEKQEEVAP